MARLPYTTPEDPASSIDALVEYLLARDGGDCVYRGETRVWPGPLTPSAFRRYHRTGAAYTAGSPEYAHSLRRVGRSFVGLRPVNFFHESFALFAPPGMRFSPQEARLLTHLSNDQYLARMLGLGRDPFPDVLSDDELARYRDRLDAWRGILDHDHRVQIRDLVFMRPFGYLLGQALAQQYGFSSEMLDVSSDPRVAAFFATHDSPHYLAPTPSGIGVMYRFVRGERDGGRDLLAHDFYSCPTVLDFAELLSRFRVAAGGADGTADVVDGFLEQSFLSGTWRAWDRFRIAADVLEATRPARQKAALIVPDMIYVEEGAGKEKVRTLMAVEDCARREGATRFYFRHRPRTSACDAISREHLWPNHQDALFAMVTRALQMGVMVETGQILPNRLDLLDRGYQDGGAPPRWTPRALAARVRAFAARVAGRAPV